MLRIEYETPVESLCDCCKNTSVKLTRFVYRDEIAFAIYYANFTIGHDKKYLSGIVGLGNWGDAASPEDRVAFAFRIWIEGDNFQVGLVDATESPWKNSSLLGRILDRKEALTHEWVGEVFHLTDHMVTEDQEIVKYFG
ncbi:MULTISPECIES: hypothetical protein [unclassified Herbaspirillum]|uniref:hypothetical protein n=1 Tax=unclassified Herbaspirillum TaxID=2624150 RepID=UPI000E2E521E|nr:MULTISPECIES: hypothetical protein [unclassified Herbaspirillum]RFB73226.1 hypothetical protein DZB54_02685 [Herbaspirillum sp. 3R-3a1]TFI10963.1 hypothetical protein E4P32_05480 [Herbaspirillum sp. 3R11]TFI16870.1 hypothetical protein E4P31_05480 [Herbaspirillum sp. 3R-11]TFI30517.1 hypothetical protein E4P30_03695 [Herbaspirillum sp. 3C11]